MHVHETLLIATPDGEIVGDLAYLSVGPLLKVCGLTELTLRRVERDGISYTYAELPKDMHPRLFMTNAPAALKDLPIPG